MYSEKVRRIPKDFYDDLIARSREIGRLAEEEAFEADARGEFSDRIKRALLKSGLHRLVRPRTYGGFSVDPRTFYDCIEVVSWHSTSFGWLFYFFPLHEMWACFLPAEGRRECLGDPDALKADVFAPMGRLEPDGNGGYRLYGKWNFASGVLWSEWIGLGTVVDLGKGPEGVLAIVPTSQCRIIRNWDVFGLRATASHGVEVDGAYVPRHRIFRFTWTCLTNEIPDEELEFEDEPVYRIPHLPYFLIGFLAISIGGAKRMLQIFKEWTERRVRVLRPGSEAPMTARESGGFQQLYAELQVKLATAEALANRYIEKLEDYYLQRRKRISYLEHHELFAWRAEVCKIASDITVEAFRNMGGTFVYKNHSLAEIIVRDLMTVCIHLTQAHRDALYGYGRALFGMIPGHQVVPHPSGFGLEEVEEVVRV